MATPVRRRTLSVLTWAAVALAIVCLQVFFLHRRVPTVEPVEMSVHGVELRVTDGWRYGYVSGMHGAMLFRVRDRGAPLQGPESADPELTEVMRGELGRTPWLAVGEGLFYLVVLIAGRWVVTAVRRRVEARGARPSLWRGGLSTLALAGFLLLPFLAWGYGGGAYTNLVGPGALSSHGTFPSVGLSTGGTVSYRTMVEVVLLPVGLLSRVLTFGSESLGYILAVGVLEEMTGLDVDGVISTVALWLSWIVVYAGAGLLITWSAGRERRRGRLSR
jgi:hypothetical protein